MKKFLEKNLKEAIPFYLYSKFVKLDEVETSYFEIADVIVTNKTDYKLMLKDQFPFLKGEEYKLICDKLDEAKEKAIESKYMAYYSAYAAFVFNKLRAISKAIYDKSNSCSNIYDVLKDYKTLSYISRYFDLMHKVKDTNNIEVEKEYSDEAASIHIKKSKQFSIMTWILCIITTIAILLTCFIFTHSVYNFIIPIIPILIACFAIYSGIKNNYFIKAECNCIPGVSNVIPHITRTNNVSTMFDSTIKDVKILSSNEFCEIVTNEKEINLHLIDAIIYIIHNLADENSKKEIEKIIYGDAYNDEIEKEFDEYKNKFDNDFINISRKKYDTPHLTQIDEISMKKYFKKAFAKTFCLYAAGLILLIRTIIIML